MPSLSQLRALGVHPSVEEVAYCKGKTEKTSKENCQFKPYHFEESFKWVYMKYTENAIWILVWLT